MVSFKSEDWLFLKSEIERFLKNNRDILENPNKTYKEKLLANGQVLLCKTLLLLPQAHAEFAAKDNR